MTPAATDVERFEDRCLLVPSISLQDVSFLEGNVSQGNYTHNMQVNLSSAATETIYVYLTGGGGTASPTSPGIDYVSPIDGFVIPVGATSWVYGVHTFGDVTSEPDEYYIVRILNVVGATIADGDGVVTILNDDGPPIPEISIGDVTQAEGDSGSTTFTFQVGLSVPTSNTVTVNYATADATALAGSDYTATSGIVTFSPGTTTQTISVMVSGDTISEPNEGFVVNLSGPVNGTLIGPLADDQGVGLITNDDTAPAIGAVRLKAIKPNAAERSTASDGSLGGVQTGEFIATLDFPLSYALTLNFDVSGSATLSGIGQDYNLSPTTSVTIAAGATASAPIIVTPIPDNVTDPNETVTLTLNGGSHTYSIYAGYDTATVKILEYGTRLLRPEDGDNIQSYTFTISPTPKQGECGCIGGTAVHSDPVTESVSIEHSNRAARPRVTHFLETVISPNAVPTNTSLPSMQRVHLDIKNRMGTVVLTRDYFFGLGGQSVGDSIRMGMESDVSTLLTDTYSFEYQLTTIFADGTESNTETIGVDEGIKNHGNLLGGLPNTALRPDYGFGDGWYIPQMKHAREWYVGVPLERRGVELTLGSGESLWFAYNTSTATTSTYFSPRGFFGPGLIKDLATGRFYLTDKYDTVSEFSSLGYLIRDTDRNGRVTDYSYSAANNNRLTGVVDSSGKGFTVTYGSNGFIDTLTDREGRAYSLNFDALTGRLSSITPPDPDGAPGGTAALRTAFNYDSAGRMTARTTRKMDGGSNPLQENTQFVYDSRGHLIETQHLDELVDGQPAEWNFAPVEAFPNIVDGSVLTVATITSPAPLMTAAVEFTYVSTSALGTVMKKSVGWDNQLTKVEESHDGGFVTTLYEFNNDRLLVHETHPTVTLAGGGTQTLEYAYDYIYGTNNVTLGNVWKSKTLSNGYAGGIGPQWSWYYSVGYSLPTNETDPLGRERVFIQDNANGNLNHAWEPFVSANFVLPPGYSSIFDYFETNGLATDFTYFSDGTPQAGLVQKMTLPDPDGDAGPQQRSEQRFTYDSRRNLLTVTEELPTGDLTWTFTYDSNDHLLTVRNEANDLILEFSNYSPIGLPQTVKQLPGTADERVTTYVYDGMGNVVTMTLPDPDGSGTQYSSPVYQYVYDKRGRLTQEIGPSVTVVLPNGTTTTSNPTTVYTYDPDGNVTSITDPNGAVTEFHYEDGHLHEQHLPDPDGTGPLGATTIEFGYDERHRLTSKIVADPLTSVVLLHETYAYDPIGNLTSVTDVLRSATTGYEYDLASNITATTDAEGRRTTYAYNEKNLLTDIQQPHPTSTATPLPAGPLWKFGYDQLGRLISEKNPLDPTGTTRETKYEYDLRSQLTKVTLPDPDGTGGNPAPFTSYTYTIVGELDKATDHLGRITDYTYNDLSELTRVDLPDPDGSGGNPMLSMQYAYDKLGRVSSVIDQRGQTTTYAYNAASWLTSVTLPDPDGASGDAYFGTNLPAPVTTFGYDANGWLRTQDVLGPNGGTLRTETKRDALGRVTDVIAPQPGSDTGVTATTTYKYDAISRMIEVTDPLLNVVSYAYNPAQRTVIVTEPAPQGSMGPTKATVSTFDKVGNLTKLVDASNNETNFAYDRLNRLTMETNPFGKQLKYEYDFAGNLTAKVDRVGTGRRTEYTYDNLERVTKELWKAQNGNALHSIQYAYDTAGRLDTVKELRGNQSGTPVLEYDFAYDNLDRVTSVVDTANTAANINLPSSLPTVAVTLSATYKTNGDLKQTFAKIGSVADYSNVFAYDNLGRLTQVVQRQFTSGEQTTYAATSTNTFTRKRVNLAYNSAGQFAKILRMSGASGAETETATSVYGYFNGGAVKQIEHWHSGANSASTAPTSLGSSISSYSWTYDTHGRAASFTAPEGTFAYGYDDTHELISATFTVASGYTGGTPSSENFSFDNTGNRTGSGVSVDKNRLMSDGTYNYTYDGEGNRTSRTNIATTETILYSWDHRNRLTKVEYRNTPTGAATKIVANTYDAFDRRVMKQVDANGDGDFTDTNDRTERYVWDGGQISLVLDATGAVLHRFLHGPAIDQVFADEDSVNGLLWDLGDNQNTTRDVIDNSGTVVNHLTYSPFGVIASESDASKTPFAAYTGRDWDEDLQLQYNRARWYEPATGRWLSEDPIRFAAGDTNLQRYVSNAPTNYIDPDGLDDRLVSESLSNGMIALYRERDPSLFASLFGAMPEREFIGFLDHDKKIGPIVRRHGPGNEGYDRILPYDDVAAAVNRGFAGDDLSALFPKTKTLSIGDSPTFFGTRTETAWKECTQRRREFVAEVQKEVITNVASGPLVSLGRKLSALEDAQKAARRTRQLPDGRFRYYGPEKLAKTPGRTRGASMVTEYDPRTGRVRQWYENYDHDGKVIRVHPKMQNGVPLDLPHYPPTGKELGGN